MAREGELDPRTANVSFVWGVVVGDPDGEHNIGRIYYWYDPQGRLPAVDDSDFRVQHPEIGDTAWARLFYEAFDRGQTKFERKVLLKVPAMLEAVAGRSAFGIGRLFGPKAPPNA
jgi:hypothetical protein